ncbi:hypothetical protein PtA15_4A117 [Puccinia triticina]|uniref:Autophagy-related protein 16 domain-containing protein n=1 Tax=Puccinia triticina TaxID=208348 RepID=A0ABY7CEN5_9BASI|nr:uncharacterized protein PtA15_4A117 [Puccinia triticina]WAQ83669.1 hypothetical protein PtA15_4A117 [Puccinia triticina]
MVLFLPIPSHLVLPALCTTRNRQPAYIARCPSMMPVDSTPLAEATNSMVKTSLLSITDRPTCTCTSEPLAAVLIPEIRELIQATRAQTHDALALQNECRANNNVILALRDECRANNRVVMTRLGTVDTRLDTIETRLDTMETRLGNIETRLTRIEDITKAQVSHARQMADRFVIPAPPQRGRQGVQPM